MKKNIEVTEENYQNLRKKLMAALAMLMIAVILTVFTSYAWLILSIAPEVTGITTSVGANGSLEIALLNTDTVVDKNTINSAAIGESLANSKLSANETWGNLIDLSDSSYGLDNLVLSPARFNASKQGGVYKINSGFLSAPTYGYDGRVIDVSEDTVTAIYDSKDKKFVKNGDTQDYGVRAIGTSDTLTVQGSALSTAKGNIRSYTVSAQNAAVAAIEKTDLQSLLLKYASGSTSYTSTDLAIISSMVSGLEGAENYIESALRYSIVAYAASQLAEEDLFNTAYEKIMDTSTPLSMLASLGSDIVPENLATWITAHTKLENAVKSANSMCTEIANSGETYTSEQIMGVLNTLINTNKLYVGDRLLNGIDKGELVSIFTGTVELTLAPESGIFADVADFAGNFSAAVNKNIRIKTASTTSPSHLAQLYTLVSALTPAGGTGSTAAKYNLNVTYGYALDLAFRCNAFESDLLLQTTPAQRVYDDSESTATMGGGSYMSFDPTGTDYGVNQLLDLMNAIRVGFVDDKNEVLGIARLNISNYTADGNLIKAPLYLYDYSIGTEGDEIGMLLMGERQKTDNVITSLNKNEAKHITAVVWLDGDLVDNTMVPNTIENTPLGMLNLQFSSSVDLKPADNNALLTYEVSKEGLQLAISEVKDIYTSEQGLYTTVSWTAFESAYAYADSIYNNSVATVNEINRAIWRLKNAKDGLEMIDQATLRSKITEVREFMGKTTDIYAIALHDSKNNQVLYVNEEYTQQQLDKNNGIIYRVDYEKNLVDVGNGVKTPVYTDESWSLLATALYDAEFVDLCSKVESNNANKPGTQEWDRVITALDLAYDSLQRNVYYSPYDYNGTLYYKAISEDADTYGLWYYNDFQRVFSDLLIIELDAYAKKTDIASYNLGEYTPVTDTLNVSFDFLDGNYPSLMEEEFIAAHWKYDNAVAVAMTVTQKTELESMIATAEVLGISSEVVTNAKELVAKYPLVTEERYKAVKTALHNAIVEELKVDNPSNTEPLKVTANQKIVLAKAVLLAKNVEGYIPPVVDDPENPENSNLAPLREAVEQAEKISDESTMEDAKTAIDNLNVHLNKFGIESVTEYNTITYPLPQGADTKEVLYSYNESLTFTPVYENIDLTKTSNIDCVLLTKSGVITEVSASTQFYVPAGGIQLSGVTTAPSGGEVVEQTFDHKGKLQSMFGSEWYDYFEECSAQELNEMFELNYKYEVNADNSQMWNHTMYQGSTFTFGGPTLKVKSHRNWGYDAIKDKALVAHLISSETIEKTEWSSSDVEVLTVENGRVKAVGEGSATIHVTVKTKEGNSYAVSSNIITVIDEPSTRGEVTFNQASQCFVATLTDGTEEIVSVEWSTNDSKIATIDKNGKIVAHSDGEVTITAKITTDNKNEVTATTTTTVKAPKQ